MSHVPIVTLCFLLSRRNSHSAAEALWSLPMPRASHQSMRSSKYAKIKIEHGALTVLALALMCVYCAEESTQKSSAKNPATSSTPKIDSAPQPYTPVSVPRLAKLLPNHPDTIFTNYVLSGMQHGFPIGHTVSLTRKLSSENHPSASRNMLFVSDHLPWCCLEGQAWGPFPRPFTWLTITRHFSLTHSPMCTSPWRPRWWKARPRS